MSDYGIIAGIFAGAMFLVFLIAIVWYVFGALFFYKIAKAENVKYPWISWIPIVFSYNMFEVMKDDEFDFFGVFKLEKKVTMILYILFPLITGAIGELAAGLGTIANIVYLVFGFCVYSNFFKALNLKSPTLYGVLTLFLYPIGMGVAWSEYKKIDKSVVEEVEETESTVE